MDYIIKRTDQENNGQFIIRPYTNNGPASPTSIVPLAPHAVSANTSLVLLGKGMSEYGELIASNFIHLLEHFASETAPVFAIQGQLWYKNNTKEMFIHDGVSFNTEHPIVLNGLLTNDLDVDSHKIINVGSPTNSADAVNLSYFNSNAITTEGGLLNLNANIVFNGGEILGLPDVPTSNSAATSKLYVDTLVYNEYTSTVVDYVKKIGDTMVGNLIMSNNSRIFLPTPPGAGFTIPTEVVNKSYVDATIGGTGLFVRTTGDKLTGPLEVNGISLYTGSILPIVNLTSGSNTSSVTIPGDVTSLFSTGIKFSADLGIPMYGYQKISLNGTITGSTSTGLDAGNGIPYTFTVIFDGATQVTVSILGSAAQTYDTLLTEINADLVVGVATLVNNHIIINSPSIGTSSSVFITDGNLLSSLTAFNSILPAIPGYDTPIQPLTTTSSVYQAPNTVISVSENIPDNASSGNNIYPLVGIKTTNDASVSIGGDFSVTGIRNIQFDNNILHNVAAPIESSDVANKAYVDGQGGVGAVTVNGPTKELYFGATGGIQVVADLTPMFTSPSHTHVASEVFYNLRTPLSYSTRFISQLSDPTHPKLPTSDILNLVGTDLYEMTSRNVQYVTTVTSYSIIDFSATSSDLLVVSLTTGAGSTVVVSGNVTATFKAGIRFSIFNNTGAGVVVPLTTSSSTYTSGTNRTTISVVEQLSSSMTNNGSIMGLYGAIKLTGDTTYNFGSGYVTFNISGSSGTGNGDYSTTGSNYSGGFTWVYLYRLTPLPTGMLGNGTIKLYGFVTPFYFKVQFNKLMVHDNGVKQYMSTRGSSVIKTTTGTVPTYLTDTLLVNGTYNFTVAVDGGSSTVISTTVNNPIYNIVSIDQMNKKITISGSHVLEFFEYQVVKLTNNTGVPATSQFTIISATLIGGNTELLVETMPIVGYTNDGTLRQPYEYQHLLAALSANLTSAIGSIAVLEFRDGNIYIISSTSGSTSQITITDGNLVSSLTNTAIVNNTAGSTYSYREPGPLFAKTNVVQFESLPIVGNILEFILTR